MRVCEYGLRAVAVKLEVELTDKGMPQPIEFAVWDKTITACRNKISEIRKLPSGTQKHEELQLDTDIADRAEYIKDLWRNDVSHARRRYQQIEALGVLERVRGFMELAERAL
jgi:hypothetical protein